MAVISFKVSAAYLTPGIRRASPSAIWCAWPTDIIYWASRESVEQAMLTAPQNSAALGYFQLMADMGESDVANTLMSVARSYS